MIQFLLIRKCLHRTQSEAKQPNKVKIQRIIIVITSSTKIEKKGQLLFYFQDKKIKLPVTSKEKFLNYSK